MYLENIKQKYTTLQKTKAFEIIIEKRYGIIVNATTFNQRSDDVEGSKCKSPTFDN